MRITLKDVQSIKYAVYDIEEKGVTQIIGENNNGKSILIKAMAFIANTHIKKKNKREPLINDACNQAYILIERLGMKLEVCIARQNENCYYRFTDTDGSTIIRTVREAGLDKLADKIGFKTYSNNVCLQIFETFGIMPFVSNTEQGDWEIIDSIISDKVANDFVETYSQITYPKFVETVKYLKMKLEDVQRRFSDITFWDIEKYSDLSKRLSEYQRNVQHFVNYTPTELPVLSILNCIDVPLFEPIELPIFWVIPQVEDLRDLTNEINTYSKLYNGVCPTCGTLLRLTGGECKHDI